MEMSESQGKLLVRAIKRMTTKLHSTKVWKKLTSLGLACLIGLSLTACDKNAVDFNDSQTDVSTPDISIDAGAEGEENVDLSKYSFLIQDIFEDEYCKKINQQIAENLNNGVTADRYGHPYSFWQNRGYDVEAIKNGEIECHTDAYILDSQPNNLYVATYASDPTCQYYEQYLLKYTLTEQEVNEYHWLHYIRATQSLYLNDIISRHKTPEVVKAGKIGIESYKALWQNFKDTFLITGGMDFIMQLERLQDRDLYYVSVTAQWATPVPVSYPSEEEWGKPINFDTYMYNNLFLKLHMETTYVDGVLNIDTSHSSPGSAYYVHSEDDEDNKHVKATQYYRQDRTLENVPQVFRELDINDLKNLYLIYEEQSNQ